MKKVYQTIIDVDHGNCMQAAIASLLDLELNDVPNFIEYKHNWATEFFKFLKEKGYNWDATLYNINYNKLRGYITEKKYKTHFYKLKNIKGVNGYFYAAVLSPKYYDKTKIKDKNYRAPQHAVIIDKNLNIIHDPNPNYQNLKSYPEIKFLKYNGIIDIFLINKL